MNSKRQKLTPEETLHPVSILDPSAHVLRPRVFRPQVLRPQNCLPYLSRYPTHLPAPSPYATYTPTPQIYENSMNGMSHQNGVTSQLVSPISDYQHSYSTPVSPYQIPPSTTWVHTTPQYIVQPSLAHVSIGSAGTMADSCGIAELKETIEKMNSELNQLRTKISELNAKVREQEECQSTAQAEMNNLREENAQAQTEMSNLREENAQAQTEMSNLREKNAQAQTEISNLREENAQAQTEISNLREENAQAQTEISNLREENAQAQTEISNLREENAQAETEMSNLREEYAQAQTEISNLREENAQAQTEMSNLREENARAQTEISNLREENAQLASSLKEVNELNHDVLGINSLPNEIILNIFGYLGQNQLAQIARVCRRWNVLTKSPVLWKKVNVKISSPSDKPEIIIIKSFINGLPSRVTSIRLHFTIFSNWIEPLDFQELSLKLQEKCPLVEELILINSEISNSLSSVIGVCTQLLQDVKNLIFHHSTFGCHHSTDECFGISKIEVLELLDCYFHSYNGSPFSKLPHLKELHLFCTTAPNSWFEDDASFLNQLQVLNLGGTCIEARIFQAIRNHGHNLKELYLCSSLTQDRHLACTDSVFPHLKTICLRTTFVSCEVVVSLIQSCPSLENVYVKKHVAESFAEHPFVVANRSKSGIVKVIDWLHNHNADYSRT